MDAAETLSVFLSKAVVAAKRERYIEFALSTKTHRKFLASLDHDFERDINPSTTVSSLDSTALQIPGYLYSSDGGFGTVLSHLSDASNVGSPHGGWLGVGQTGLLAIYLPEGRADDVVFFKL